MPCCSSKNDRCNTCGYSFDGDITCYSPLIRLNPPQDAEWVMRNVTKPDKEVQNASNE